MTESFAEAGRPDPEHPIGVSAWERASACTRFGRYRSGFQLSALRQATALTGGGTALDIGCDEGRWSLELRGLGWRVICADRNSEALDTCRARLPDARCVLVDPDGRTLPGPERSTRMVLAYEVPPVTQAPWFADEARRVLEPGGALVCTYHNPLSWRGAAVRAYCSVSPQRRAQTWDPYRGPTYAGFRRALVKSGFRLVREQGITWMPLTSSSDSRLVWTFSALERALGLRKLPELSPTVVVVAVLGGPGTARGRRR